MMSYLVFARKYRPQTFEDVVEQSHVTQTLANAIEAGRMAHALLFSGPRGTGKTTVARVLAKAMNCAEGPTRTPCNTCRSCREITAGHAADVFEIDGASNNSVDQVRELRDNLKYMPSHSRYKIYIIDEVHMLSLAAFNALLKTLEEPPDHILFMFATTELHKIPVTILSRCQRHDLRRIDAQAIARHLHAICEQEQAAVDMASLALIAQEAGGSMRDALSLLDHVLSCAQGPVTVDLLGDLLGIVDRGHLFQLSEAVLARDIPTVLQMVDAVWRKGYAIKRFFADLVSHFHHLTLVKMGGKAAQLVDLPGPDVERMQQQVAGIDPGALTHFFDALFQAEPAVKLSSQPRYALEMVFLRLLQVPPPLSVETLIDKLEQLRATLASGQPTLAGSAVDHPGTPEQGDPGPVAPGSVHVDDPAPEAPTGGRALDGEALWQGLLHRVAQEKPSLAGSLNKCRIIAFSEQQIALEISGSEFVFKNVQKHLALIEQLCSDLAARPLSVELIANIEDAKSKQKQKRRNEQLKQKALGHPMVMQTVELFDGKVVDIVIPRKREEA